MPTNRAETPIDRLADDWVDFLAAHRPTVATYIGRAGFDDQLGDYGPDSYDQLAAAAAALRTRLRREAPRDAVDELTRTELIRECDLQAELHAAGAHLRDLNVIACPAEDIRTVFDLMPTATVDDWAILAARLGAVPGAISGYMVTLARGAATGVVPAQRQVHEVADQIDHYTNRTGFFAELSAEAELDGGGALPASLARDLDAASGAARVAFDELANFLRTDLAQKATKTDAVGRDAYALASRHFLGTEVDLDETYEWGVGELARMITAQERVAHEVLPGASLAEAVDYLDQDASRRLSGIDALQAWMQETSDHAIARLNDTHFAIPKPARTLHCQIAPTHEGGIYYTGPTEDFARPGQMWWSVPEGVTEFATWRELTTIYHEGVPGHHLQIAQTVYNHAELNSWRRLLAGTSGHAEGWALYAEQLMYDLGFLDDPADRLGMLEGQRLRAARVVVDIGVHLGKQALDGSGTWNADSVYRFLRANVTMPDEVVRFEVNRYLGWPGQAPAYKVGQRLWEQVRDQVRRREGASFDIKRFHQSALNLGGVGLDSLAAALS